MKIKYVIMVTLYKIEKVDLLQWTEPGRLDLHVLSVSVVFFPVKELTLPNKMKSNMPVKVSRDC